MPRKKTPNKRVRATKPSGYLVATFEKFPGVAIPLLSDEECKARGIEPQRLPPMETWSPEQQEAGRKLRDVFMEIAVKQVYRIVLRHLQCLPAEGAIPTDFRTVAMRRALAELRGGAWRPEREEHAWLQDVMQKVLESLLQAETRPPSRRIRSASRKMDHSSN
jgi:hypothetical protein